MKAINRSLLFWVYGVFALMLLSWWFVLSFQRVCSGVSITIKPSSLAFVNKEHITHMLQYFSARALVGTPYRSVDTHHMEQHLTKHDYIASCQIHKDLSGTLHVQVTQEIPLARLLTGRQGDYYLMSSGILVPVSIDYTERVVVIEYPSFAVGKQEIFARSAHGLSLFYLADRLYHDAFWREQIAQVSIGRNGTVSLYPQLTRQVAFLGDLALLPKQLESQLSRLKVFYTQILPSKGWDFYQAVDVRYDNQIIGRRNKG